MVTNLPSTDASLAHRLVFARRRLELFLATLNSEPEHVSRDPNPSHDLSVTADPDRASAELACSGDPHALEALVLRHQDAVARLLWRFARNRPDLEDLVQDTFLRMVRSIHDWQPQQPFAHWLLRIATNVGRDYFRRQAVRRRWMVDHPSVTEEPAFESVSSEANPAAHAAANEVKSLLARLPPDDRTLLTLHHLEGWGLAQIARQFGWTLTATKLRAWRARNRLRTLLQPTRNP